jgi:hypothetical protein
MPDTIDIKAKAPVPAGALNNLAPHAFTLDGVACASMEGFLHGLKVEDLVEQERICKLSGGEARGARAAAQVERHRNAVVAGRAGRPAFRCLPGAARPGIRIDVHELRAPRLLRDHRLVDVAPLPVLARLERLHDRVLGRMEVLRRVAVGR